MKITRRTLSGVAGLGDVAPVAGTGSALAGPSGRGDLVEVSEAARLRQRLRSEIGDLGAIAGDRVSELRAELADDRYHPAPSAIAERLLTNLAIDLLV